VTLLLGAVYNFSYLRLGPAIDLQCCGSLHYEIMEWVSRGLTSHSTHYTSYQMISTGQLTNSKTTDTGGVCHTVTLCLPQRLTRLSWPGETVSGGCYKYEWTHHVGCVTGCSMDSRRMLRSFWVVFLTIYMMKWSLSSSFLIKVLSHFLPVGPTTWALPNRGSLLFGKYLRLLFSWIWMVTLNFEAMLLSFIIINVNIVILDIHSRSTSSIF